MIRYRVDWPDGSTTGYIADTYRSAAYYAKHCGIPGYFGVVRSSEDKEFPEPPGTEEKPKEPDWLGGRE